MFWRGNDEACSGAMKSKTLEQLLKAPDVCTLLTKRCKSRKCAFADGDALTFKNILLQRDESVFIQEISCHWHHIMA